MACDSRPDWRLAYTSDAPVSPVPAPVTFSRAPGTSYVRATSLGTSARLSCRSQFRSREVHVSALGVIVGSGAAVAWLCIVAQLLPRAQYRPNQLLLSPVTLPLGVAAMLTVTSAIVVSAQPRDATAIAVQHTATVQRLENGTSSRIFVSDLAGSD